uniref:Uncharacterized protein n=1 Tax=Chromera velia CCMP2878 TaxID=1169474 RepID=A0A0G4I9I4_9ALVE|eukprot:Cvel_12283.t1-p1 / transcript=Cvel_12283.t1 / gene=Cvel_12283 / organism=Chromera_velia_CCMP2878 / gene_product=hypothetical protein / transcript_product=hypothetical protein / location=Cvel_scaffold797:5778-7886(+) / protein_length=443 / sequence_SO=supercontig / SO=protein_coding / is_pseudo=false
MDSMKRPTVLLQKAKSFAEKWAGLSTSVQLFMIFSILMIIGWLWGCLVWGKFRHRLIEPLYRKRAVADPMVESGLLTERQLLLVRFVFFVIAMSVWGFLATHPPLFEPVFDLFDFYTIWNYGILTVYFGLMSFYGACRLFWVKGRMESPQWRSVRMVLWELFQQQLPCSAVVALVFWVLVFPNLPNSHKPEFVRYGSLNQHGTNFLMMLFEFFANDLPVYFAHSVLLLSVSCLYLWYGVAVFGAIPSMPHLNLTRETAIVELVCVLLFHLALCLVFDRLSVWKFSRLFPKPKYIEIGVGLEAKEFGVDARGGKGGEKTGLLPGGGASVGGSSYGSTGSGGQDVDGDVVGSSVVSRGGGAGGGVSRRNSAEGSRGREGEKEKGGGKKAKQKPGGPRKSGGGGTGTMTPSSATTNTGSLPVSAGTRSQVSMNRHSSNGWAHEPRG